MQERIWREGATPQEVDIVRRMDLELANLAALRATIVNERQRITNRACQRARYRRRQPDQRNQGAAQ